MVYNSLHQQPHIRRYLNNQPMEPCTATTYGDFDRACKKPQDLDDDCDYIPPSNESSSDSNISGIIPLQFIQQSTPQPNRSGEPARLTLREWTDASHGAWIHPELIDKIGDPQERLLLKDKKLAYQAGKGSRKLVSVLFPKDTLEPVSKLLKERTNCNIHQDNNNLFPNTQHSLDQASGYHCLRGKWSRKFLI
ncbi:hypothetical protein RRG08_036415 [Elysia crispata]|uniref:Uncharacterized protein n=1 Tax=Elysia crispata TaxID=231223 RepID=A0AAE0ZJX5_9GAST|nr:hypothetical protein RRG08_036415 [Elysia crispata]